MVLEVSSSHYFIGHEMMNDAYYVYVTRNNECFMIVSSYIDDILLVGNNLEIL